MHTYHYHQIPTWQLKRYYFLSLIYEKKLVTKPNILIVSVIIPVRNRKTITHNILVQLYKQISQLDHQIYKIHTVVVDDNSSDGTSEMIIDQFPEVHLIQGDGNLWWTGAIVQGMKYAVEKLNTHYILWLNDDIYLSENFIEKILELCSNDQFKDSLYGGLVRDNTYHDWIVYSGFTKKQPAQLMDNFSESDILEVDALNGNIVIIPKEIVEKIGFPDRKRFLHYGGDYEFSYRAKSFGFKVLLCNQLIAKTDYTIDDLIRYMPPLLQWHLKSNQSCLKRFQILKGLTNIKTNYNIWHMLNIIYWHKQKIPIYQYWVYYIKAIIKLLVSDFWPTERIEQEFKNYFQLKKAPTELAEAVMYRTKLKSGV